MIAEKFVERAMIEIFNMIQFEDFPSYVLVSINKGNNDMASLWEYVVNFGV
jgi:hypothetical protein